MIAHPAILQRLIGPQQGGFPPELAHYLLTLEFPKADPDRYTDLSAKAQDGTLSQDERSELDDYLGLNDLLTILKSKALVSLKQHCPAA